MSPDRDGVASGLEELGALAGEKVARLNTSARGLPALAEGTSDGAADPLATAASTPMAAAASVRNDARFWAG